jgi:hypothetical protein
MLYSEIITVCSEIHTKHINTLCGQNVEFVNVKPGGAYSNHWTFKGYSTKRGPFILHMLMPPEAVHNCNIMQHFLLNLFVCVIIQMLPGHLKVN